MAEEQALLPFIQQAYGQGLKAPSIEPFKETFKRNADQKREEFKSASELGLELDAKGWGIWSKQIESLYEKAKTGEITVGSAEWFAEKQKASASAGAMKQAQDLIKEHEDGIIKMSDQFIYSQTDEAGKTKVMGLDDFRKNIRDIYDRDFKDEMTPMEVVNEITNELGKFTSLPMGVNTALKEAQTRGLAISRELQRMGGDITAVSFKNGQVVVATTQDDQDPALAAKTAEEVQALADQYKPYLELKYETDTPTDQKTPDGKEGYVQDFIKSLLFTERSPDVTSRNPRANLDDDGSRGLTGGNGRYSNNDFSFTVTDAKVSPLSTREGSSIRSARSGESDKTNGSITVIPKDKGEPLRTFMDGDGDRLAGRLDEIKITNNIPTLIVRTESDRYEEIPLNKQNIAKLEEFYGVTEQDIDNMIKGGGVGAKLATSTPRGTNQNSGVGSKYNK